MRRAAHPKFDNYPVWRQHLVDSYAVADEAHRQTIPSFEDKKAALEQEYVRRSIEYEAWCRTSPEWADIKKKILWRSRGHCEACLSAPAEVVHHLTYEAGKLPPAWHLRAVCIECHGRLHWRKDEWCAYGMARGQE